MPHNTESDATYCSDVEKEVQRPIRRSKRLSQRNLPPSFRSNEDSTLQRISEIYRMLKFGTLCSHWLSDDWQALQFEVGLIKKTLKGRSNYKISFISKKINENLQHSSSTYATEIPTECQNVEPVKSPNILAGMMSEALTEIPPYQPQHSQNMITTVQCPNSSIALTQKNPLDLTKKHNGVPVGPDKVSLNSDFSERNKQLEKDKTPSAENPCKQQKSTRSATIPEGPIVELTEKYAVEGNQENTHPAMEERTPNIYKGPVQGSKWYKYLSTQERKIVDKKQNNHAHISKWSKYIPTQDRPVVIDKPNIIAAPTFRNKQTFKDSLIMLYKDKGMPTASTSTLNKTHKSTTSIDPRKPKRLEKPNPTPTRSRQNENLKQKSFRNTESIVVRREPELAGFTPRNVQSEHFCNLSPDFLLDELFGTSEDKDSVASLTPSIKEGFKNVFGTDNLKDFFGCNEEVYSYNLKESHVRRLAKALNVEHNMLKKTIEQILSKDSCEPLEDDMRSDSSVIECSQSPKQRLFPSQRSQVSK